MEQTTGALLFYGGLVGMGFVLVAAAVAVIVLRFSGLRLRALLDETYGKQRD
jgi:hypothetical protein